MILEYLEDSASITDILGAYTHLTEPDVRGAIAFARDFIVGGLHSTTARSLRVRLSADENQHPLVVSRLRTAEYEVEWIAEVAPGMRDIEILRRADIGSFVFLTFDCDSAILSSTAVIRAR